MEVLGPLLGDVAELVIARLAEVDAPALTTLVGHRTRPGQGLEGVGLWKAAAIIAELDQQTGCEQVAGAGQEAKID